VDLPRRRIERVEILAELIYYLRLHG
jgi:hypothetical protein